MRTYENEQHLVWKKPEGGNPRLSPDLVHIPFRLKGKTVYFTSIFFSLTPLYDNGELVEGVSRYGWPLKDLGKVARTVRVCVAKEIGFPLPSHELDDPVVADIRAVYSDQIGRAVKDIVDRMIAAQYVHPRDQWSQHPTPLIEWFIPQPVGRPKGCARPATSAHPSKMHARIALLEESQAKIVSLLEQIAEDVRSLLRAAGGAR